MSKLSIVPAREPQSAATDLTLAALRAEIDGVDDEILQLVLHRQRLAGRVGAAKGQTDHQVSGLKLRPDREAKVIARRMERVEPSERRLAQALWRELMSAGLSIQGQLEVAVWSGARKDVREAARSRFGGCADYKDYRLASDALDAALEKEGVAVLALDGEDPWWTTLLERHDLWIFEGVGRRGPMDPAALAVGKLDPAVLAHGVAYRISTGGDSCMEGRSERVLAVSEGRRLCVQRDVTVFDRENGIVGSAAVLG